MVKAAKKYLRPALFALAGGAAGLLYYRFFGCRGACPITSSPVSSGLYMMVVGLLLSNVFPGRSNNTQ